MLILKLISRALRTFLLVQWQLYDHGVVTSFTGLTAGNDFCDWLFSESHAHYICIFHNLMSNDYVLSCNTYRRTVFTPKWSSRDWNFCKYTWKLDLTIRVSLAFLPISLRFMPKAFDFLAKKGMFPFLFAKKKAFHINGRLRTDSSSYLITSKNGASAVWIMVSDGVVQRKNVGNFFLSCCDVAKMTAKYCVRLVNNLRAVCVT